MKMYLVEYSLSGSVNSQKNLMLQKDTDEASSRDLNLLMFTSMNVCNGAMVSMRDDFESIFNLLAYLNNH